MNRDTDAILLAGGRATRMGGIDKGLLEWQGQPLVSHVLARIAPQVGQIFISANRNLERYRLLGYPVIPDRQADFQGPLAGLVSAGQHSQAARLLIVPCDTPELPEDLLERLEQALLSAEAEIAIAHDGERTQQLCLLMTRSLVEDAADYLASGERRVISWLQRHRWVTADFSHCPQAFRNLNRVDGSAGD